MSSLQEQVNNFFLAQDVDDIRFRDFSVFTQFVTNSNDVTSEIDGNRCTIKNKDNEVVINLSDEKISASYSQSDLASIIKTIDVIDRKVCNWAVSKATALVDSHQNSRVSGVFDTILDGLGHSFGQQLLSMAICSSDMWARIRALNGRACTTQGIDINDICVSNRFAAAYDRRFERDVGESDYVWIVQPKAIQIVCNNENRLVQSYSSREVRTTIVSPNLGITYDLNISKSGTLDISVSPTMFRPDAEFFKDQVVPKFIQVQIND